MADIDYSQYNATPESQIDYSKYNAQVVPQNTVPFSSLLPTTPIRDVVSGLATAGQNIHNFALPESMATNVDFNQALGINNPTMGDVLTKGFAQYAPSTVIPAGGEGLMARAAISAIPQSIYGMSQSPENRLAGGALGALAGALPPTLESGFNALRPSVMLRGNLSPEQLTQNLQSAQGSTTPLGNVLNSPMLQRTFENILPHIAFGGTTDKMQQTANDIVQRGSDLMNKINEPLGDAPSSATLQQALKDAAQEARANKNQNYAAVNDAADKAGLVIGRDNFKQAAKSALSDINQSQELKDELPNDISSSLKKYAYSPEQASIPQPVNVNGQMYNVSPGGIHTNVSEDLKNILNDTKNQEGNSLKLSNIFKGKLNDKANQFYQNGQMYEYGIMKNLKDALGSDIDSGIENSGDSNLQNLHETAQKNYQENFAPFEDPDITKFTRQGGDPDTILSSFLKTGTKLGERSNLLAKLQSKMPEKSQNLLPSLYLSNAMDNGQLNPVKFSALYNNLSDNQKNILFSDKNLKNAMDNYSNLVGMNRSAFNTMANPNTGQRTLDTMTQLGQILGGFHFGHLPGVLGAYVGPALAARTATNALTSPGLRQSLVNAMIRNKQYSLPNQNYIGSGLNSLLNQQNQ